MFCLKSNNDVIEKYNINYDKKEMEALKQRIIEDCSEINHEEYDSDYWPRFSTRDYVKNFKYELVGKKEYFEETRDVYHYSFDEYIPPCLVSLIDMLLNDNISGLVKIINYEIPKKLNLDGSIDELKQKIKDKIDNEEFNIDNEESKLKEILYKKKINENQKPLDSYYKELLSLISFDLVDVISVDNIKNVESFFEINLLDNNTFIKESNNNKKLLYKKMD